MRRAEHRLDFPKRVMQTSWQRRVLVVVGGLIALASLAWVAAAAGNDDSAAVDASSRRRERPASTETTDTTLPLVPVTGGEPLPTTSTVPASVPLPSAEQVAAAVPTTDAPAGGPPPPPALTADGAFLTRPATEATRPVDKAKGCNSANDPGWRIVECGALKRDDVVLLWVVEARGAGLRALVLRERTAGQWATVLSAADDAGTRWSKIGVRGADVSDDGRPDLVFGFHVRPAAGSAGVLAIDVVDGPGTVTLHRELRGGSVRAVKGAVDTWAAGDDGSYEYAQLKLIAGAWRVAATKSVARADVPPSMV